MSIERSKIVGFIKRTLLLALFVTIAFSRCANPMAPQGGPKDTIAPQVISISPAYGTTNFAEKKVFIEFDEYVKLKDQQKEFYTSPEMKYNPILMVKGRGVEIEIKDTLRENTTYVLNLGSAIEDNNESNALHGLRYVFSTGDEIDSMVMSGYTTDAFKKDSVSKTFIYFYTPDKDSVPEYDSTLFNCMADAIARAENNGIFVAENIKPIPYRIYAMQDNNNNRKYEPGTDMVGFLDDVYNPLDMPAFEVWFDTMRMYLNAEPQLYFRMFKDEPFKRQVFKESIRPTQNKIVLVFGAPFPQIDTLEFEGIDASQIVTEYLRPTKDSMALWINLPKADIPDTIKGKISYLKHDSLNVLMPESKQLSLAWRLIETKEQERERLKVEKEREKTLEEGGKVDPLPNTFKYEMKTSGTVNPETHIQIEFVMPLIRIDSSAISMLRLKEDDAFKVRSEIEQDSINMRLWTIKAPWIEGEKYSLTIPAGAFENIARETNDTLKAEFSVMHADKYAKFVLNVVGKTPQSQYILQVTDEAGSKVMTEVKHVKTGKYTIKYINPGNVRIKIIEDLNGNGEWDNGNLVERRQPERVEIYTLDDGVQNIVAKEGWEVEFTVDMSNVFRLITMEDVVKQLRVEEEIRVRKHLLELLKNPKKNEQDQRQQQNQSPGGQFGGQGGGQFGGQGGGQFGGQMPRR